MEPTKVKQNNVSQYWIQSICKYLSPSVRYVNPVRNMCPARMVFDAIEEMGLNKWHHIDEICAYTRKLMSTLYCNHEFSKWDEFYTSPQSKDNPQARLRKIVLSLKNRYVLRLEKMGCSVVYLCKGNDIYLRLNTGASKQNTSAPTAPKGKNSFLQRIGSVISAIVGIFHG